MKYENLKMISETFFVLLFFFYGMAYKLPSTFEACKRTDEHLNNCLKVAIENALPQMKNGIHSLSVAPIDPLKIESMMLETGSGIFNVTQKYKNIKIYNMSISTVDRVELIIGENDFTLLLLVSAPKYRLEAEFTINANLLLFPVNEIGKGHLDIVDSQSVIVMIGELFKKKGETYIKITGVKMDINPRHITFDFKDFFNGDEVLGKIANDFLNDNWKETFSAAKYPYEETTALAIKQISNAIFTKIPLNKLFPL